MLSQDPNPRLRVQATASSESHTTGQVSIDKQEYAVKFPGGALFHIVGNSVQLCLGSDGGFIHRWPNTPAPDQ